jgi:predicted permease
MEGWRIVDQLGQDIRISVRRLLARPATTALAVGMLALAIGITTAMFSLVDAFLLRPMPFRDPDRLAHLQMASKTGGRLFVEPDVLRSWRELPGFEAAEGVTIEDVVIEAGTDPVARAAALVSPGMFDMLGARPLRGRLFNASDAPHGAGTVAVISEDLWRGVFGADHSILGRQIRLGPDAAEVIGVLPREFRFPAWNTQVWRPIDYDSDPVIPARMPRPYVRFSPSIPEEDALRAATEAAHLHDPTTTGHSATRAPEASDYFGARYMRTAVPILFGGVTLVFVVLCINVGSLLLMRFSDRRREFAMCAALGASRSRLVWQAIVESSVLGTMAAAAGMLLAWILVATASLVLPVAFLSRSLNPLNVDIRAAGVAVVLAILATLVAGCAPAALAVRTVPGGWILARTSTETRHARLLTRAFLTAEVAFACALLVAATLLVRSFINLSQLDAGFDYKGLVTLWTTIDVGAGQDNGAKEAIARQAAASLGSLPRVRQVAMSRGSMFAPGRLVIADWQPDRPESSAVSVQAALYEVEPHWLALNGIRMVRGRGLEPRDPANHVVLSERLASQVWPGADPIGRSFVWNQESYRVVGLAEDTRRPVQDMERDFAEFYRLFQGAASAAYLTFTVRCDASCPTEGQMRARVMAAAPRVRVIRVSRLDELYREELAQPRATATLSLAFASVALIATSGGLFSVLSHAVGRRRREFGIRLALGGSPRQVRSLVARDSAQVAVLGVALGSVGGWLVVRTLEVLLYGVTAADPWAWTIVLVTVAFAAFAGTWPPATQAMRVNPAILLREE